MCPRAFQSPTHTLQRCAAWGTLLVAQDVHLDVHLGRSQTGALLTSNGAMAMCRYTSSHFCPCLCCLTDLRFEGILSSMVAWADQLSQLHRDMRGTTRTTLPSRSPSLGLMPTTRLMVTKAFSCRRMASAIAAATQRHRGDTQTPGHQASKAPLGGKTAKVQLEGRRARVRDAQTKLL